MKARLFLSGIRADGHHGARPGEKDDAQPFVVDLDLEVEVGADEIGDIAFEFLVEWTFTTSDAARLHPRAPRLEFDEACSIL